jgi:hypothetical protein
MVAGDEAPTLVLLAAISKGYRQRQRTNQSPQGFVGSRYAAGRVVNISMNEEPDSGNGRTSNRTDVLWRYHIGGLLEPQKDRREYQYS